MQKSTAVMIETVPGKEVLLIGASLTIISQASYATPRFIPSDAAPFPAAIPAT